MMALQKLAYFKLPLQPLFYILKRSCKSASLRGTMPESEVSSTQINPPKKLRARKKVSRMKGILSQGNFDNDSVLEASQQGVLAHNVHSIEEKQIIKDRAKALRLLLKDIKKDRYQYLLDSKAAERLVDHLKRDLKETDVIVEMSPGLGVLTEALLTATSNPVLAYEPCDSLKSHLEATLLPHHSSLHLYNLDMQKFYAYYIIDKRVLEANHLSKLLSPLPVKGDQDVSPVKITGVIYDLKFFSRLTLSFSFQCCFFENIFPVFYLYVSHKIYTKLIYNHYRNRYISGRHIFWYYFTLEELDTAPRASFLPIPTLNDKKRAASEENLHLVKISHNSNFLTKVNHAELENFHFFMGTVLQIRRGDSLVLRLERWLPDCGPELIKNGIHPFAHPRDLNMDQLFLAYQIFSSCPSYHQSVFHIQRSQYVAKYGEKTHEYEPQPNVPGRPCKIT